MIRIATASFGVVGAVAFLAIRPEAPLPGSDCEATSTWIVREPVAAITALAIVAAGWTVAARRPLAGSAVLLAGVASFAAHATAHPGARALDGVAAVLAVAAVIASLLHTPPPLPSVLAAAVTAGAGSVVWMLTRTGAPLCENLGPVGHGTWHVSVAISVLLAFSLPLTPRRRPYSPSDQ